jgi:DNA-directed RNA polymerase specialized sigma subunit
MPKVEKIANRFPKGSLRDEIRMAGIEAAIQAVDSWDYSKNSSINAWGHILIWQQCSQCFHKWKTKHKRMQFINLYDDTVLDMKDPYVRMKDKQIQMLAYTCCRDVIDTEILHDYILKKKTTMSKIADDHKITKQAISKRRNKLLSRIKEALDG